MKNLITWSLLLLLFSCSPQRRLNRLVRKHPELVRVDSVVRIDTIVVQRFDTITNTELVYNDSVVVMNNERVRLEYYFDTLTKEIWHEVECKEIYVSDTNVVTINKVEPVAKKKWYTALYDWLFPILIGVVVGMMLFRR